MKSFPAYRQLEAKDCGATCIRMICKYYGKSVGQNYLRNLSETTRQGTSLHFIAKALEKLGFKTLPVSVGINQLKSIPLPAILHWNQDHFVVLHKVTKNGHQSKFLVADPELGIKKLGISELSQHWISIKEKNSKNTDKGICLLLEKSHCFNADSDFTSSKTLSFRVILKDLTIHKSFLFQLMFGMLLMSLIQIIFPFLAQAIVDIGIRNQDLEFIYILILAQSFLFLGKIGIEIARKWILLHLSARLNFKLLSSFFIKLMRLPIAYFDSRLSGDLLNRIRDHRRIEYFFTHSTINILFSIVSTLILSLVLVSYSGIIFSVFLFFSVLYVIWISLFFKKRKRLDKENFAIESKNKGKILEVINGMQDIKLNGLQENQRWTWEKIQIKLFRLETTTLRIALSQDTGGATINEFKNLSIILVASVLVVQGELTLGALIAITYLIGQLNMPFKQMIQFLRDYQDAKISLERIAEIHNLKNEDSDTRANLCELSGNIYFKDFNFRYKGTRRNILNDFNLEIKENKTTAIVGHSGSGKTTVLKLMLGFYEHYEGKLLLGERSLGNISKERWRQNCATITQDSYVFNETVLYNITLTKDKIDNQQLKSALFISNSLEFINDLPIGVQTRIGNENLTLSKGQLQRILIARAVYKNPKYVFFDEATSALDADNEAVIADRLRTFFKDKTVVIIAHRLSTVVKADQIVVLKEGRIVEKGTHQNLIKENSNYYHLIKNQLQMAG